MISDKVKSTSSILTFLLQSSNTSIVGAVSFYLGKNCELVCDIWWFSQSIQVRKRRQCKIHQIEKNMHPSAVLQMARGKGKTVPIKVCDRVIKSTFFSYLCHLIACSSFPFRQLLSSAGTGYFYTTRRNVTRTPDKFKFVKFDPIVRRRVLFTEHKIK